MKKVSNSNNLDLATISLLGFLLFFILGLILGTLAKVHAETLDMNDAFGWAGDCGSVTGALYLGVNPKSSPKDHLDLALPFLGGMVFNYGGQKLLRGESLFDNSKMSKDGGLQLVFGLIGVILTDAVAPTT